MFADILTVLQGLGPLETALGILGSMTAIFVFLLRKLKVAHSDKDTLYERVQLLTDTEKSLRAQMTSLEGEIESVKARLPDHVLQRALYEIEDGNEDKAGWETLKWYEEERKPVAELLRHLGEWLISFQALEPSTAIPAGRLIEISALLNPEDAQVKTLATEIAALLAEHHRAEGNLAEMEASLDEVVAGLTGTGNNVKAATTLSAGAALLHEKWHYGLAAAAHRRALRIVMTLLGPNHPGTLSAMHNLAVAQRHLGRPDKCVEMLEQVLEKRSSILGPEDPDTLLTMNSLAVAHGVLGDRDKATEMLEQVLEKQSRIPGPDHPDTLHTIHNLAFVHGKLGDLDQCVEMLEQALEKRSRILGPDHLDTIVTRDTLKHAKAELEKSKIDNPQDSGAEAKP